MEIGINKTNVGKQLKEVTSDITLINEANSDMLDSLTKKLNLQEQKLQKMPTADKIYEDTLKRIDKNVEDIELLKSEQARNFFKDRFEGTGKRGDILCNGNL